METKITHSSNLLHICRSDGLLATYLNIWYWSNKAIKYIRAYIPLKKEVIQLLKCNTYESFWSWVVFVSLHCYLGFSENYRLHFINAQTASVSCWASFSTVAQRIGIKDAVCWIWKCALINPGLDCSQYWWGGGNPQTPHGCEDWLLNTVLITSRGKR